MSVGPVNNLGLQEAGFPNIFTITGPGSPSVLSNMPVAIEQHVNWVTGCIDHMERNDIVSIETTQSAMDEWVRHADDMANADLMPKANYSWYHSANVPDKPILFMPYARGLMRFRAKCDEIATDGCRGFVFEHAATA